MPDGAITMRLTKARIAPGYQHELEGGNEACCTIKECQSVDKQGSSRHGLAYPESTRLPKKGGRKLVQSNTIRDSVIYMELGIAK